MHYVLVEWGDERGFVAVLDRPSGVLAREDLTGITLCHSGSGWGGKGLGTYGVKEYAVSLLPYTADEKHHAVWAYQRQAYPLALLPGEEGPLSVPELSVEGHSVVSGLYREADRIVVRVRNPLGAETLKINAPGMQILATDLEGNVLEDLGAGEATFAMRPMQIATFGLLRQ